MRRLASSLQPGEIVEICSEVEIAKTLDENGCLDKLPFMREMRKYCGGRFKVSKCVSKMFVEGIGNRGINDTFILEGLRCNGEAHDGCRRTCLLLWKRAWLRRADENPRRKSDNSKNILKSSNAKNPQTETFLCQLTSLPRATARHPFSVEDFIRQYLSDPPSSKPLRRFYRLLLWSNFKVQRSLGRKKYATLHGISNKTPSISMNLKPGDVVQVKSKEEILATLDFRGKNRGLSFTAEMLKYCGGKYRVMKRVDRMIVEKTGKMRKIANTVILEGVTCDGSDHGHCPLKCYSLWREIWLRRN